MYQPELYGIVLLLMVLSMVCWGSWANTMKLTPGYSFQLFYWDYVAGILLSSVVFGLTLGMYGGGPLSLLQNISHSDAHHMLLAVAGGAVFNIANLLLVAAIDMAGLAVAFPIGIGLALVVGVLLNYVIDPQGQPVLLFGGVVLVMVAILLDALAYRRREAARAKVSSRGVWLSLACGVLMGVFYPLVAKATSGTQALGPYSVAIFFAIGVFLCALPANFFLMKKPVTGTPPVSMAGWFHARPMWHVWGAVGGAIWCTGAVLNFVASHAKIVGPAVSYAIGQGATMVSALWGVFIWREFATAPPSSRRLILPMFLFFIAGLASVAIAPIFVR